MATINMVTGGVSATRTKASQSDLNKVFSMSRALVASEIIAADTTATANGYIAVDDVVQAIFVPADMVLLKCCFKTVTAGTATATCDIGKAGGQECDAAVALDATAGTQVVSTPADANADDFVAGDTVDVEFLTANCLIGSWILYILGWQC